MARFHVGTSTEANHGVISGLDAQIWASIFVAPPGVLMDIAAIVIHPAELAHDVATGALKYRPIR